MPGRQDALAGRRHELRDPYAVLDRHRHDLGAFDGDHIAEVAPTDQPGRRAPEAGGEHSIEGGRRAAALDVPEDGGPDLVADALRQLLGEPDADPAEPDES